MEKLELLQFFDRKYKERTKSKIIIINQSSPADRKMGKHAELQFATKSSDPSNFAAGQKYTSFLFRDMKLNK